MLFDQFLGPFSVILQPRHFHKIEFISISNVPETARKVTKIL